MAFAGLTPNFLLLLETYFRTILCAPRFLLLSLGEPRNKSHELHAYSVLFFRHEKSSKIFR